MPRKISTPSRATYPGVAVRIYPGKTRTTYTGRYTDASTIGSHFKPVDSWEQAFDRPVQARTTRQGRRRSEPCAHGDRLQRDLARGEVEHRQTLASPGQSKPRRAGAAARSRCLGGSPVTCSRTSRTPRLARRSCCSTPCGSVPRGPSVARPERSVHHHQQHDAGRLHDQAAPLLPKVFSCALVQIKTSRNSRWPIGSSLPVGCRKSRVRRPLPGERAGTDPPLRRRDVRPCSGGPRWCCAGRHKPTSNRAGKGPTRETDDESTTGRSHHPRSQPHRGSHEGRSGARGQR